MSEELKSPVTPEENLAVEQCNQAPAVENANQMEEPQIVEATPVQAVASAPVEEVSAPVVEEAVPEDVVEEAAEAVEAEAVVAEAVEAEAVEAEKAVAEPLDYSKCSLKDLVNEFTRMLEDEDKTELLREGELIRSAFYKAVNKIKEEQREARQAREEAAAEAGEESALPMEAQEEEVPEEVAFKRLYANYKVLRAEFIRTLEQQKEQNLQAKQAIIEELKNLLEKQEDLNHTFPSFRALQARWKEVGPVPPANTKDVWDTYQHYVEKFYDYVKINNELRDLDFKRNLELKTKLCEAAEALVNEPGIISAFHKLQKLHEQWREIGPIARELREQVWERFKNSTTEINKRHQAYFEDLKVKQKENLEAKTALCDKVDMLNAIDIVSGGDWNKYSKELEEIQKQWKTLGFASKKDNQRIYDRFRAGCDAFYTKKREFYASFKNQMQENYEKKIALCEQAEALRESDQWRKTTDVLINLQKQWKAIGPVPRKQSDAVWKRFRAACDAFFTAKSTHFSSEDRSFEENLAAKRALIEELGRFDVSGTASHGEAMDALKDFQTRWNAVGFVPFKEKEQIQAAFKEALDSQYNNLRTQFPEARAPRGGKRHYEDGGHAGGNYGRYERGGNRNAGGRNLSERDRLVLRFRQMEADIAVLENNIGFFAKSKNADKMIRDIHLKIDKAKEELAQLEQKIKELDQQQAQE